jgi:hypothetical protein
MKAKIKGNKVNLKDWRSINKIENTILTKHNGVQVEYEIQIYYPNIDERKQRKRFTYEKEKDMIADYQRLILKVLLK